MPALNTISATTHFRSSLWPFQLYAQNARHGLTLATSSPDRPALVQNASIRSKSRRQRVTSQFMSLQNLQSHRSRAICRLHRLFFKKSPILPSQSRYFLLRVCLHYLQRMLPAKYSIPIPANHRYLFFCKLSQLSLLQYLASRLGTP